LDETAFAKINLALHVRERLPDGYHAIETVFAFCEDGDRLSVQEGRGLTLSVTGPFAGDLGPSEDNLVLRAARALHDRYRPSVGAALNLEKHLPVASGIGGGSADAAAALRLLTRWWGLDAAEAQLRSIARTLGADVAACLASRAAWGAGRGDSLRPLQEDLARTPILLVNPRVPLSTASVFSAWDGVDRGPLRDWRTGRNDLEAPAISLVSEIAEVLEALGAARMSGSGATCFALFETEAQRDRKAQEIAALHPRWWQLATRLR
jgi:4-diphosphocytidyl-2-C-methyl-D-erythritol kinase